MFKTNVILGLGVLLASVALSPTVATGACPTFPYTFTNGTTADASQVNGNFNNVISCFAPLASPTFTGTINGASEALTQSIGSTSTTGAALINPTAATSSQVQYSPALQFTGFGWNTTSGASHELDWRIDNETLSNAVDFSRLYLRSQQNGGGYGEIAYFSNVSPQFNVVQSNSGGYTQIAVENIHTAPSTISEFVAYTGTTNATLALSQQDGTTPTAIVAAGAGDTGGLQLSATSGPITMFGNVNQQGYGENYITSGTSWTSPSYASTNMTFKVTACGGGNKGGVGSGSTVSGGGGGAGACCVSYYNTIAASTAYTIAIGSSSGGSSTFSDGTTTLTASGGSVGGTNGIGGATGTCTNATYQLMSMPGGSAPLVGGAASSAGMPGGSSALGAGGAGKSSGTGNSGAGCGAGGSGAASGSTAGSGTGGCVLVEWVH
jgi:hypothetical protein